MRKLGLKIPAERQIIFKVKRIDTGQGVIYEIGFGDAQNLPRDLGGSEAAAAKQPRAEKQAEPAGEKAAQ